MKVHCKCGQPIEFESSMAGLEAPCPSCNQTVKLNAIPPKMPPAKKRSGDSPQVKMLEKIRYDSAYEVLRSVIKLAIALVTLPGALSIFTFIVPLISQFGMGRDVQASEYAAAIFASVGGVVWCILCYAIYQASLLVVDIADTAIYQQRMNQLPYND